MAAEPAAARHHAEARFQDAYARFLTDERFREVVLTPSPQGGPAGGLGRADLDRLRAMDQERVALFAQCLSGNRVAAIAGAFPLSAKVLGEALPALVRTLDAQDVAIDTRKYPEAVRFADFVLNGGAAGAQSLPDPVLGLLRYELAMLNLRLRPQSSAWPEWATHSAEALRRALGRAEDVALVLNRNHALLGVGFDVEALREADADAAPFALAEAELAILLHRGDSGEVHQKRLNHASAAAILMIGESATFRALVATYAAWLDRPPDAGLEAELGDLCIGLCACGALGFAPVPAGHQA